MTTDSKEPLGLTERELWLMQKAWMFAYDQGVNQPANQEWSLMVDWLGGCAAGGRTVAEALAKDAPAAKSGSIERNPAYDGPMGVFTDYESEQEGGK